MKLSTCIVALFVTGPLAHADFAGCRAISIGLFSSQTYSSCYECKGARNSYCREICSVIQYTCTSMSSSGSVAPWMNGTATDESQGRAAANAMLDCLGKAGNMGATCREATCVSSFADGEAHDCR